MSSRTENGDLCLPIDVRTADRGPRRRLPTGRCRTPRGRHAMMGQGSDHRPDRENAGWTIFSYLIAGMLVYGGLGWLIGHWTRHPIIFPLGMLTGLALSTAVILYRYGRS